jgi:hypothetical protein
MYFEMLFSQLVLEIWFLLHIFISIYLKSHEIYCHHFGVIRDGGGVFVLVNGGPAIFIISQFMLNLSGLWILLPKSM